jgi:hypothetical protein
LQGGEIYGGSLFARSAAPDTLQGQAIQKINYTWGDDVLDRPGRECLGIPVCKKKYKPFGFRLETTASGRVRKIQVQRLFACASHHEIRKRTIEQYGERPGWEPFGQWSLKKAKERAKQEFLKLQVSMAKNTSDEEEDESSVTETSSSSSSTAEAAAEEARVLQVTTAAATNHLKHLSLCKNGDCCWKVKSAYDDIVEEMGEQEDGEQDSDNENNARGGNLLKP